MIIIKNIEFIQTDRNVAEILSCLSDARPYDSILHINGEQIDIKIVKESIRGRRYVRPSDNTDVYVGITKDAADILGLLYTGDKQFEEQLDYYRDQSMRLTHILNDIQSSNFWKRLKYLFFGVK